MVNMITYLSDREKTLSWNILHMETTPFLTLSSNSTSSKNLLATISRASDGQVWNGRMQNEIYTKEEVKQLYKL